jgi:hypothetical protein
MCITIFTVLPCEYNPQSDLVILLLFVNNKSPYNFLLKIFCGTDMHLYLKFFTNEVPK